MATVTVTTAAQATTNGWNFCGAGDNWWAEKACQSGGKLQAVAATSAALITAIQSVETFHGRLSGNASPEFDKNAGLHQGHI